MKKFAIYALVDPRAKAPRYVGKSVIALRFACSGFIAHATPRLQPTLRRTRRNHIYAHGSFSTTVHTSF